MSDPVALVPGEPFVPTSKWMATSIVALVLGTVAYVTDTPFGVPEHVELTAAFVVAQVVGWLKKEYRPATVYRKG